jgi:hypothetical protein
MLSKMLKTSESAGVKYADRHPVGGVVLTKITLEDESTYVASGLCPKSPQNADSQLRSDCLLHYVGLQGRSDIKTE